MKTTPDNLTEALIYQLRGLYDAEKNLQKAVVKCLETVTSKKLKAEIANYAESTQNKLIKLERVFNYLMDEPEGRKNGAVNKMIEDTHELLKCIVNNDLRDSMMIACIQNINHFKIAGYGTARAFALELNLETPAELLSDILRWEKETDRALTKIAIEEINRKTPESLLSDQ